MVSVSPWPLSGLLSLCPCPGVEGLSLDVSCLVDIRDYVNKELALRVHTDIKSQDVFFTDLNGFQVHPGGPGSIGLGGLVREIS